MAEHPAAQASVRKIARARRRGAVPHSRDLPFALTFAVLVIGGSHVGVYALDSIRDFTLRCFGAASANGSVDDVTTLSSSIASAAALGLCALGVTTLLGHALAGGMAVRGADASVSNGAGEKLAAVFSRWTQIERAWRAAKLCVLLLIVGWLAWDSMAGIVTLMERDAQDATRAVGVIVLGVAKAIAALWLVMALLDVLVQRWIYFQRLRMGRDELRREQRDDSGDPAFRTRRRDERVRLSSGSEREP
jgi:flagellar biosynthesis protein FlhB